MHLTKKDLLVRIEAFADQAHQLLALCIESKGFRHAQALVYRIC